MMGTGLVFILIFLNPAALSIGVASIIGTATNEVLLCLPLFVFMSSILRFSGISEALFDATYKWTGRLRGSLAVAIIWACTIIAAMTGIGATGVVTMSLVAYPEMKKRNYSDTLTLGSIAAGGALGPIIPPSGNMIIVGMLANVSVGKLFAGGFVPGVFMAALFTFYIIVRCYFQPYLAPKLPAELVPTWKERFSALRGIIAPAIIIVAVLGGIYSGAATATEAAAIGASGAGICALINRRLNWQNVKDAVNETLKITVMCLWLVIGGTTLTAFLNMTGISSFIAEILVEFEISSNVFLAGTMFIVFVLGMFIDPVSICVICIPLFLPIVKTLGLDVVWFCLVFVLFVTTGYLTPPFGMNLFYLKGCLAHENIPMIRIYRSAIPFAVIMTIVAILSILFPKILMWLPNKTL
jgi:tripartite ATP-independent transporter DctM subunit